MSKVAIRIQNRFDRFFAFRYHNVLENQEQKRLDVIDLFWSCGANENSHMV